MGLTGGALALVCDSLAGGGCCPLHPPHVKVPRRKEARVGRLEYCDAVGMAFRALLLFLFSHASRVIFSVVPSIHRTTWRLVIVVYGLQQCKRIAPMLQFT